MRETYLEYTDLVDEPVLVTVFTMDNADNDHYNPPYADKRKNDFAIVTNQNAVIDGSGITNGRDRTPWASPADFDKKGELLIALYENLSLVEVMRIMEEDHGFRATYVIKFLRSSDEPRPVRNAGELQPASSGAHTHRSVAGNRAAPSGIGTVV